MSRWVRFPSPAPSDHHAHFFDMTNTPVSLTIQLTQDEVYRASVRVMLRKLRIFIFLGVIFLLIVGGAFVAHPSTSQELLKSILPFFYLMFAFCVAVFVVHY